MSISDIKIIILTFVFSSSLLAHELGSMQTSPQETGASEESGEDLVLEILINDQVNAPSDNTPLEILVETNGDLTLQAAGSALTVPGESFDIMAAFNERMLEQNPQFQEFASLPVVSTEPSNNNSAQMVLNDTLRPDIQERSTSSFLNSNFASTFLGRTKSGEGFQFSANLTHQAQLTKFYLFLFAFYGVLDAIFAAEHMYFSYEHFSKKVANFLENKDESQQLLQIFDVSANTSFAVFCLFNLALASKIFYADGTNSTMK